MSSTTQLLEHRVFTQHYGRLTSLFHRSLLPHLIAEGVLLQADLEEIDSASTSEKKAHIVLMKITASLDARLTESFYKLLAIMKSHGNRDLQELASLMKTDLLHDNDASKFVHVSIIFAFEILLNYIYIKSKCMQKKWHTLFVHIIQRNLKLQQHFQEFRTQQKFIQTKRILDTCVAIQFLKKFSSKVCFTERSTI